MLKESSNPLHPGDRLAGFDFAKHNAEVEEVWDSYEAGNPIRTPIILGLNARYYMAREDANPEHLDFKTYTEDPRILFETQLQFQRWSKHNLLMDFELGVPKKWEINIDFQNYSEAAWFGCPIEYFEGQVPDTRPIFASCPEKVMENGIPNPQAGILAKGLRYYDYFKERAAKETYYGSPIEIMPPFIGTDGIMTVACNLFGPEFVCTAMATEPDRLHHLFDFITEATILRMKTWRKITGLPERQEKCGFCDDSIALISTAMYKDHVLPYHRMILEELAGPGPRWIHLCGDATRHFVTLQKELDIQDFDTGFPVNFGQIRKDLGPGARILGGPHVELLRTATPNQVYEEVKKILTSGVLEGGLFVLREGNNLAPGTPIENTEAMYRAGRDFGFQRA